MREGLQRLPHSEERARSMSGKPDPAGTRPKPKQERHLNMHY
jgi:hypothetical protein